jgi:hypothetical protein
LLPGLQLMLMELNGRIIEQANAEEVGDLG